MLVDHDRINVIKMRDRQTDGQTPYRCFTVTDTDVANVGLLGEELR